MKYKHIIGLDIGTNSLGWCLIIEYEDGTIEIVKTGVHIFPIGTIVDDKSNKEKTKNEQRRGYRGASRMRYRFKLRRGNLSDALKNLGMSPDYSKLLKAKGEGQSYELYKLRAEAINPKIKIPLNEIGRIFMLLNKYRGFKSNAKNPQEDKETGIIKKGINDLKDKMNAKNAETIGQYFFMMHEKAKKLYDEDKWHNFNEPIDERAYINGELILFNSNGIRRHHGRATEREMYLYEFDKIWEAQKNHYPEKFTGSKKEYDKILDLPYKDRIIALKEFKKTNYWHIREYCIYYQRPLKSQKKYVSNCQFERGFYELEKSNVIEDGKEKTKEKRIWTKKAKKACPKSHPLFQEFRLWQKLHQINYSSTEEDIFKAPLKKEWLPIFAEYLMENKELYLNETKKARTENKQWFGKILHEKGLIKNVDDYSFYIDKSDEDVVADEKSENKITGNITLANFKEALGNDKFVQLKNGIVKRKEQINETDIVEVEESRLYHLWHHLYIAKDALFKETEWLKCILTEPTKWDLSKEQAQKLIDAGLPPDYCSYSSKVLKAILPHMRNGLNEHEALKVVDKGYINDDNTVGKKILLKDKISQLTYQELRNPVAERSLSKSIKLVNAILDKYKDEIDINNFEIRIESTRQLRKPRQERENERRKNADKDKLREQYAKFLTSKKAELGFSKDIHKYNSLINKYELWLQMNMNEEDEVFVKEFKAFSKITKKDDKLKHRLWLECGRLCPYTGRTINLTNCFSSEIEIEHIIPLSRSLDNSFNNKTLTFRNINTEKGSMTPFEYLNKKGGEELKKFKARIIGKRQNHDFSDSKKKQFLVEKIDEGFLNRQLSNTSYIGKYTRTKMQEVCKHVQFTNGSATSELRNKDWHLSNLLDKIRYEEEHKLNIDEYYENYYTIKKDFLGWYKKQFNTTDFKIDWKKINENNEIKQYITETNNDLLYWNEGIEKFNEFRNKSGKKDRSDHRHHAIDAFITACCSPKIIKAMSTANALKENNKLVYRDKVEKCFNYEKLKNCISNILVSHSEKQTLVKKRKNKIKTKNGIIEHYTYAPQGKLHEESFYAKRNGATVRRVELFDDQRQEKALFEDASKLDYSVKGTIKWHYIDDKELYEVTKQRLTKLGKKSFTKDEMEKSPFFRVSPKTPEKITSKKKNKPLPIIKSIRKRFNTSRTLINLPAKDKEGNILTDNRYTDNESNSLIVFYENIIKDNKGKFKKPERDFEILSFYKNVSKKNPDNEIHYTDGKIYMDEKNEIGLNKDCKWLKTGDLVALYIDEKDKAELDWKNNDILKDRIFIVKGLSSDVRTISGKDYEYGYTSLLKNRIAKTTSYTTVKEISESINSNSSKVSHVKLNAIKVRLSILGEIIAKGDECF